MISQLSGRKPRLRTRARISPARRPAAITASASSMVSTMPDRMSGRYLAMTLALKNVSRKWSQRFIGSVALDLPDEGLRAVVGRALEDLRRRSLFEDQAV